MTVLADLRRWLGAEPTRVVIAAFSVVLLLSAAAFALVVWREASSVLQTRQESMATAKARVELLLRVAETQLALIEGVAESFVADRPEVERVQPGRRIAAWLARSENGLHSFELLPAGERGSDVGNLIAFDDARARRAGLKRGANDLAYEARMATTLNRAFQAIHRQNRGGSVRYISAAGMLYVYPWVTAQASGFSEALFSHDVLRLGRSANNPERGAFWTPAYPDPAGTGLVATHATPIYRGDDFLGVVAVDLALDGLRDLIRRERSIGTLMVADRDGRLVASSDPAAADAGRPVSLAERVPGDIEGRAREAMAGTALGQILGAGHVVTFRRLDLAPWTLVEVVPMAGIYAALLGVYATPAAAALAALLLLFALTYRVVGNTFRLVRSANAELDVARVRAEEATRSKSQFLAMMSHEIRTPMNGVMSMAEMLDQTELSTDQRSMSQVIRGSAQALLTVINDVLDFSKIEAGKLDIEAIEFSLVDVVEGAGELIAGRADEKGLALTVDIDPAIPDRLIGDPSRLRQVLLNLLGNAVKFTETGGVTLAVGRVAPGEQPERLRFEVTDTGIGLSPEQQGRLFEAFQQADTSTSRRYGGTGLGLSICRRLVERMDGRIGVDSRAGQGSTFWVELAFPAVDAAPERPEWDIAEARILALGFARAQADALARLLAAAGITQIRFAAADGDSVAGATEAAPDLAIVAVEGGGDAALHVGRALAESGLRVALAAPRALASTLGEADRAGLFAAMTLPLRRRRLWRVVAAALGRTQLDDRSAADAGDGAGWAPPDIEEARAAGVLILVAEDNGTNRIVISRLLSQRGYAHEMAEDGMQALAKIEAGGRYGLLLTDFHMPRMDGFELTRAVRSGEAASGGARLPIVALTADALAGTEQRCLDAGMDGYLTKPIDSRLLEQTLSRWLPEARTLRRRPSPAAAKAPAVAAVQIDPQVLDMARVVETFGGVNEAARGFLKDFAGEARRMALEVTAALAADDREVARDRAHDLKGAARSTGARRLGQLAADIQDCLDGDDMDSARLFAGGLAANAEEFASAVSSLLEPA